MAGVKQPRMAVSEPGSKELQSEPELILEDIDFIFIWVYDLGVNITSMECIKRELKNFDIVEAIADPSSEESYLGNTKLRLLCKLDRECLTREFIKGKYFVRIKFKDILLKRRDEERAVEVFGLIHRTGVVSFLVLLHLEGSFSLEDIIEEMSIDEEILKYLDMYHNKLKRRLYKICEKRVEYGFPLGYTVVCIRKVSIKDETGNTMLIEFAEDLLGLCPRHILAMLRGTKEWQFLASRLFDELSKKTVSQWKDIVFIMGPANGIWIGSEKEYECIKELFDRKVIMNIDEGYLEHELTFVLPIELLRVQKFILSMYDWQLSRADLDNKFKSPSDIAKLLDSLRWALAILYPIKVSSLEPYRSVMAHGLTEMGIDVLHKAVLNKGTLLANKLERLYDERINKKANILTIMGLVITVILALLPFIM